MSLAIARVPLLMVRGDTLVLVDDDWRTASGPWLMCLVCGDPLEVGASYAFAEWGLDRGVIGSCCAKPACDSESAEQ